MCIRDRAYRFVRNFYLPCGLSPGCFKLTPRRKAQMPAFAARIAAVLAGVRSGGGEPLAAAAIAWVEQILMQKQVKHLIVFLVSLALRVACVRISLVPVKAERFKSVHDTLFAFPAAAVGVEIFHAEDKSSVHAACIEPCQKRGR